MNGPYLMVFGLSSLFLTFKRKMFMRIEIATQKHLDEPPWRLFFNKKYLEKICFGQFSTNLLRVNVNLKRLVTKIVFIMPEHRNLHGHQMMTMIQWKSILTKICFGQFSTNLLRVTVNLKRLMKKNCVYYART